MSELQIAEYTTPSGETKTYSYPKSRWTDSTRVDGRHRNGGRNGGKKAEGEKKGGWQISEMWDNHHEIARRLVLGQSGKDIAEAMGCSPATISNVRNSPVVKDKLSIMRAARDAGTVDLAREIADLAPLAIQRIKEVLEAGSVLGKEASASVILKEANGLLDREMGKAIQRVDTRGVHAHLSMEDLDRIKQRAQELAGLNE